MPLSIKRYFTLLAVYLKPQWPRVLLTAVLLFGGIGLQLLNPQILRYFIDTALAGGSSVTLLITGLLFVGIALLTLAVSVLTSYLSEYIAWTATNHLRTDLLAHCLSLDMGFHKLHTPGELIERIDGDVDALSNFFSQFVIYLFSSILLTIGILIFLFSINLWVGLAITAFGILAQVMMTIIRRRTTPFWVALRQISADFSSFLGEQLTSTEDIRSNGASGYVMKCFYLLLHRWLPINRRAVLSGYFVGATLLLIFTLANAVALSLGAYLWSKGIITVGTVYLIFSYTSLLAQPIEEIQAQLQDFQQAEACIQRIEELFHAKPALSDGPGIQLPPNAFTVEFRTVSFGYTASDRVLRDVTFQLSERKVLGIVGRTGSGKTTLARLLFRLYDPQEGEIFLSGVPIQTTQLRELRQRIGMVTQDVQIFQASVRNNLTFFNPSISDAQIFDALDEVGLKEWLSDLPLGLDTEMGSDGIGISAGQAQLLAFARVFLTDPSLVILDEASSRLDPATEQLIERATSRLISNRTAIIIAHRLTTLQHVDEIMVLEDGMVIEHGERKDIVNDSASRFTQLLRTGLEEISA